MKRPLAPTAAAAAAAAAFAVFAAACNTEECQALKKELEARQELLKSARRQAGAYEAAHKRAQSAETNAKKVMGEASVDLPESKISADLTERVNKIPTATISREAITISQPQAPDEEAESVTQWSIRFDAKDAHAAFDVVAALLQNPPLVRFTSMIREAPNKNRWRVEIRRAEVDQMPINPKLQKLKPARNLEEVPTSFGFCGAGKIRHEIGAVDAEVETLRADAEALSVALPTIASYEGLRHRTEQVRDEEAETRDHLALFEEALTKSGTKLKAIGTEADMSVLEIWGTLRDRGAAEKALIARGFGESLQVRQPAAAPGVERIRLRNAHAYRRLHPAEAAPKSPLSPTEQKLLEKHMQKTPEGKQ